MESGGGVGRVLSAAPETLSRESAVQSQEAIGILGRSCSLLCTSFISETTECLAFFIRAEKQDTLVA